MSCAVAEVVQQDAGALPTAVFSGSGISYVPSEIAQQSTIDSLRMLVHVSVPVLLVLLTKKLKSPDSDDTVLQRYIESDF